ncbi:sigma-24 (FecI-like) protein [Plesiocystis pacifica SIR-1]|uniref:Sigma-24 (FecI-like) protein n=1 Tax=Plesiocystis pacifica SIR-1 TaxID=391625 RepID=A6G8J6_9BACT|nr:sigma-70 family RNA polymerase sigma factor [Plesiocystis pacifica]EDM77773.1 sigma-24 (FecI-like) protein [Plesiocystis pacifica SIR-1]
MRLDELYSDYCRAPDGPAKERLGRALERFFVRHFSRRCGPARARDLSQSAIETVWRKLPDFEPEHDDAFSHWLTRIAHYIVLYERARRPPNAFEVGGLESAEFHHPRTSPSGRVRQRERMRLLQSELQRLQPRLREAIEDQLRGGDVQGYARRHGLPPATVRTHRRRGREALRQRIELRERTPSR